MSYYVDVVESVEVRPENVEAFFSALKANVEGFNVASAIKIASTLKREIGNLSFDDDGGITIYSGGELYWCDTLRNIFAVTTPFVEGKEIVFRGEDGSVWRNVYDERTDEVLEQDGTIAFPSSSEKETEKNRKELKRTLVIDMKNIDPFLMSLTSEIGSCERGTDMRDAVKKGREFLNKNLVGDGYFPINNPEDEEDCLAIESGKILWNDVCSEIFSIMSRFVRGNEVIFEDEAGVWRYIYDSETNKVYRQEASLVFPSIPKDAQ